MGLFLAALLLGGCGRPSFEECLSAGLADFEAGNYMDALAIFKHAAELDRERPEPSYYQGRCYMAMADRNFREGDLIGAQRQCDHAINRFDAAIGAFPGYSRAVQAKADALRLRGRNAAAIEIAEWAARYVGPQAKMLILKAREYAQAGDVDRAQLSLQQAVSMEPENAAAHAELGLFYMRCGNETAAIRSLKKAYELDPGAPGVVSALARLGALSETPSKPQ